jgi:aspartyl/glutamyl-tRNA(Asn/Gln) amidotransferase C subunit
MTTLTIDDIKKLADLSKLAITNEKEEKYLKDINGILGYVGQIANAKIDGKNIEDMNMYNFHTIIRDDQFRNENEEEQNKKEKEIMMQNVPQKSDDNYVKVAKVIKK